MKIIDRLIRRTRVFRETENKLFDASQTMTRLQTENAMLADRIPTIVEKLGVVSVQRPPMNSFLPFRVVVEFSQHMVEEVFVHGNDKDMISRIGEEIGRRAAYEIRQVNFRRWER